MSVSSIVAAGRRLVATSLLDACVISRRSVVRDGSGGKKETWVVRSGGEVACRFVALSDEDPVINLDSVFGRAEAVLLLPLGTVFAEGDRVLNTATEGDGSTWQIVATLTPPSNLATVARAAIKKVASGPDPDAGA